MAQTETNKGWIVTLSGTGINLALGILYTWSIFKSAISDSIKKGGPDAFAWDKASINDPYALSCLLFAFAMIIAGKLQDKIGPRYTAMIGGVLVGSGFIICSQTNSYALWILGFGVLFGMGMGFGYSSATPPALKWFPPAKTGMIAGIVVAGFGLAPIYIAPLASFLLGKFGIQNSMLYLGIGFTVVVCGLSNLLINPPQGYVPGGAPAPGSAVKKAAAVDLTPSQLLSTVEFYILWTIYFIGAGAGLMVIGSVAGLAKKSMGTSAFIAVAVMAVGNAGGRVVAGVLSDKIGRRTTLLLVCLFQAALMIAAVFITTGAPNAVLLVLLATFIGFNYGANLCLFPSYAKDLWGLKNFGINYGCLFTAWGVGGLVLVRVAEMLKVASGDFTSSFYAACGLLIFAALLTFALKDRKAESVAPQLAPSGNN
ncbi:MAG: MFS transporter [Geobacter sp.]|nr:MAG: MFS transporter [Geobacter sp.]